MDTEDSALAPKLAAPQHKPRPLPLFLEMLRSETAADPERMKRALAGLRAYQEAPRQPSLPLMPAVGEAHGAKLRDYGGSGRPVLFVPSLINPPNVLDLSEEKSLLRWLAEQGHHVLLLDWGWDVEARREMTVADHVEHIILPLIHSLDVSPALVGYCLGGAMAAAAAASTEVRKLVLIAAPWRFSGFPEEHRTMLGNLWSQWERTAAALGVLPMEALQSAFWSLDPFRTVAKFEAFGEMPPGGVRARSFVTLEDWANDGPPVSAAAAREIFVSFFRDDLPGSGRWSVCGKAVDLESLPCPLLNIISTADRIVPFRSAADAGERLELEAGHVGMVIGRGAKSALWSPMSARLAL